eukprot:CAMPEP_0184646864 /NCGR_PEP_ID=MMETSP0308-20130426/3657_1 /TAXON_ID=38269 /ORGANISM="Gloeochaete witrockiana, Strain SAG 46.84" /LENGTH=107 /DNA_ID=CAMNT_0027077291 /DNA_START=1374 /DNA_END=1694 /DNA_ORIENTATION=+
MLSILELNRESSGMTTHSLGRVHPAQPGFMSMKTSAGKRSRTLAFRRFNTYCEVNVRCIPRTQTATDAFALMGPLNPRRKSTPPLIPLKTGGGSTPEESDRRMTEKK